MTGYYIRDTVDGEVRWPRRPSVDGARHLAELHVLHTGHPVEVCDQDGRVVSTISGTFTPKVSD